MTASVRAAFSIPRGRRAFSRISLMRNDRLFGNHRHYRYVTCASLPSGIRWYVSVGLLFVDAVPDVGTFMHKSEGRR